MILLAGVICYFGAGIASYYSLWELYLLLHYGAPILVVLGCYSYIPMTAWRHRTFVGLVLLIFLFGAAQALLLHYDALAEGNMALVTMALAAVLVSLAWAYLTFYYDRLPTTTAKADWYEVIGPPISAKQYLGHFLGKGGYHAITDLTHSYKYNAEGIFVRQPWHEPNFPHVLIPLTVPATQGKTHLEAKLGSKWSLTNNCLNMLK